MSIPRWVEQYVGIPFDTEHNCWWMVFTVLLEQVNITVPKYTETDPKELIKVAKLMKGERDLGIWSKVEIPKLFDVVQMGANLENRKAILHTGIMINSTHVLHIEENIDSVVMPLTSPLIKHRVVGFFRHRELV